MSKTIKWTPDTVDHRPPQNCEFATNFMHFCLKYV
jgi:hypothetical protein